MSRMENTKTQTQQHTKQKQQMSHNSAAESFLVNFLEQVQ